MKGKTVPFFKNLKDSINKGLANHPFIPDFSRDQCQKPFYNKKKFIS